MMWRWTTTMTVKMTTIYINTITITLLNIIFKKYISYMIFLKLIWSIFLLIGCYLMVNLFFTGYQKYQNWFSHISS